MKIGVTELLIILAIVVVLFGPKQIPKLAKMFGKSAKSFKEGMEEDDDSSANADAKVSKTEGKSADGTAKTE